MSSRSGVVLASLLAAGSLFGLTRPVSAQDADTSEIQRYVLTEAALAKYVQATKNLGALTGQRTGCDDEEDDDSDSQSIDQMVATLNAQPGASAAVRSAGMSAREYVVFSMSLLQNGLAAWAVGQPGGKLPAGVLPGNVEFIKTHDRDLKQLEALRPKDNCSEE